LSTNHLKKIHAHSLQDVYEWAGEFRNVPIEKGGGPMSWHSQIWPNFVEYVTTFEPYKKYSKNFMQYFVYLPHQQ